MSDLLTPAECRIVNAVIAGHTATKVLAQLTGMKAGTIRTHMSHIFDKTNVQNKTELVLWALRNGWTLDGTAHKEHPMIAWMPCQLRRLADQLEEMLR